MLSGPGAIVRKARTLRKEMSLPEALLWRELRQRPSGLKFRRQHPIGPYVIDFACMSSRLAIEIDGEAHERGGRPYRDDLRDEWLARQEIRVLRIAARDVLRDLDAVIRLIVDRSASPQPLHQPAAGPPPRSGEDLR